MAVLLECIMDLMFLQVVIVNFFEFIKFNYLLVVLFLSNFVENSKLTLSDIVVIMSVLLAKVIFKLTMKLVV